LEQGAGQLQRVKMRNKQIICLGLAVCLAVFLVGAVSAFGVAYSYSQENPYPIVAGESGEVELRLQNMVGGEGAIVKASLKNGAGIAQMTDKEYNVPFGVKNVPVIVSLNIPAGTPDGTEYLVVANFQTVTSGESGVVSFGTGMDVQLPVKVIAKPTEVVLAPPEAEKGTHLAAWLLIIGVIILLIIIWWLASRKKKPVRPIQQQKSFPKKRKK
jgi:hypothetical protein